jgi:hypothetical protein
MNLEDRRFAYVSKELAILKHQLVGVLPNEDLRESVLRLLFMVTQLAALRTLKDQEIESVLTGSYGFTGMLRQIKPTVTAEGKAFEALALQLEELRRGAWTVKRHAFTVNGAQRTRTFSVVRGRVDVESFPQYESALFFSVTLPDAPAAEAVTFPRAPSFTIPADPGGLAMWFANPQTSGGSVTALVSTRNAGVGTLQGTFTAALAGTLRITFSGTPDTYSYGGKPQFHVTVQHGGGPVLTDFDGDVSIGKMCEIVLPGFAGYTVTVTAVCPDGTTSGGFMTVEGSTQHSAVMGWSMEQEATMFPSQWIPGPYDRTYPIDTDFIMLQYRSWGHAPDGTGPLQIRELKNSDYDAFEGLRYAAHNGRAAANRAELLAWYGMQDYTRFPGRTTANGFLKTYMDLGSRATSPPYAIHAGLLTATVVNPSFDETSTLTGFITFSVYLQSDIEYVRGGRVMNRQPIKLNVQLATVCEEFKDSGYDFNTTVTVPLTLVEPRVLAVTRQLDRGVDSLIAVVKSGFSVTLANTDIMLRAHNLMSARPLKGFGVVGTWESDTAPPGHGANHFRAPIVGLSTDPLTPWHIELESLEPPQGFVSTSDDRLTSLDWVRTANDIASLKANLQALGDALTESLAGPKGFDKYVMQYGQFAMFLPGGVGSAAMVAIGGYQLYQGVSKGEPLTAVAGVLLMGAGAHSFRVGNEAGRRTLTGDAIVAEGALRAAEGAPEHTIEQLALPFAEGNGADLVFKPLGSLTKYLPDSMLEWMQQHHVTPGHSAVVDSVSLGSGNAQVRVRELTAGGYLSAVRANKFEYKVDQFGVVSEASGEIWQTNGTKRPFTLQDAVAYNNRVVQARSDSWRVLNRGKSLFSSEALDPYLDRIEARNTGMPYLLTLNNCHVWAEELWRARTTLVMPSYIPRADVRKLYGDFISGQIRSTLKTNALNDYDPLQLNSALDFLGRWDADFAASVGIPAEAYDNMPDDLGSLEF